MQVWEERFHRWARGRVIVPLTLVWGLFQGVFFPLLMPLDTAAENTALDLRFWYTPEEVFRLLGSYPSALRLRMAWLHLTLDGVYPLVYGLLLSLLLAAVYRPWRAAWLRRVVWLPWGGVLADYVENLSIAAVFWAYPDQLTVVARLAAVGTAIKWSALALSVLLLALGGLARLGKGLVSPRSGD